MFPEEVDSQTEDSDLHGGRIRSFKHERGNWATYVYLPCKTNLIYFWSFIIIKCHLLLLYKCKLWSFTQPSAEFLVCLFSLSHSCPSQTILRRSSESCWRSSSQEQRPVVWFWAHRRSSISVCLRLWCLDTTGSSPSHRASGQAWHTARGVLILNILTWKELIFYFWIAFLFGFFFPALHQC